MIEPQINFWIFLAAVTLFSIIWGRVILFNSDKDYINKLTFFIMRFSRAQKIHIHSLILGMCYFGTFIVGSIIFSVLYRVNVFKYFLIKPEFIPFIFIGIFAEISVSNMVMFVVSSLINKVDWVGEIKEIPWIDAISRMPEKYGPFVPLLGAFFEEFFYRGVLFLILINVYPQIGLVASIAIPSVLFALQQMLNSQSIPQAITMAIGSISVSIIGCLLFLHTNSFLPALIAHESFVIFYFRQMGFSYELQIAR